MSVYKAINAVQAELHSEVLMNKSAFPTLERGGNGLDLTDTGMDLRDYFAAAVIPAIYKEFWFSYRAGEFQFCDTWPAGLARDAYRIADAMMAEREQSYENSTP